MSDACFNYPEFYAEMTAQPFHTYVELGVCTGASICFLAKRLLERGHPFKLYGVDLWEIRPNDYQLFLERMRRLDIDFINILREDSGQAASWFEDKTVDFVFIDANHDYEHVCGDIRSWLPKIRPGGILAGHDYGEPCGVKQAVDELIENPLIRGTVWCKQFLA